MFVAYGADANQRNEESASSMLRIATYNGTTDELVQFVNLVWNHSYADKMTFPCWTSDFFEWQFRLNCDSERENLIAAYDESVLAGVLLGTSYPIQSLAGRFLGSHWSWLSVHPDYRNRGIAKALDQERVLRQQHSGTRLIASYRYVGSSHSQAERPRSKTHDRKFNRKIGFWARVLDCDRFAKWHWSKVEGILGKLAAPFMKIPSGGVSGSPVREFILQDLDACVQLVRDAVSSLVLSLDWDSEMLRHQLCGHSISQTLVVEEAGVVTGFVNYHLIPFRAKTIEKVAVIDLIVLGSTSARNRLRLLNTALARMRDQGAVLALKVRCGDAPIWPLLRAHFIPQAADSMLVLQSVGTELEIPGSAPIHLLWR